MSRADAEAIGEILIDGPGEVRVPLRDLAGIEEVVGPRQITRENNQRFITTQCNVVGRDIGSFVDEAQTLPTVLPHRRSTRKWGKVPAQSENLLPQPRCIRLFLGGDPQQLCTELGVVHSVGMLGALRHRVGFCAVGASHTVSSSV